MLLMVIIFIVPNTKQPQYVKHYSKPLWFSNSFNPHHKDEVKQLTTHCTGKKLIYRNRLGDRPK
jgi:hypothetical protein